MSKVGIALALFVITALSVAAVKSVNKIASANGKAGKSGLPRATGPKTMNFVGTEAQVNHQQPGIANPFPALTAAIGISFQSGQSGQPGLADQAAGAVEGFADLNPINRSGIRALINVKKIGQTETITGFATNMDPHKAYISLFSDAGSPGSGPCACIPSNPAPGAPAALQATCKTTAAPPVNFNQMVIGYWLPLIGSTTRTLQVLKAGGPAEPAPQAFVALENIGSVSVREDTQLGQPLPAAHDPNRFQLRACGKFRFDTD
ncbi:MAG: hypothetical protein ACREEM_14450 [Blastocatellia bacterium]